MRHLWFCVGLIVGVPLAAALPRVLSRLGLVKPNFRGEPLGTAAGLMFLAGALGWLAYRWPVVEPVALAAVGFGALGFIDDRWGTAEFKGLRGHLRALRSGRVTTGLLKAVGGMLLASALAWWMKAGWPALLAAPLVALCANFMNLLDLRPLRALKVFWVFGGALFVISPPLLGLFLGLSAPYAFLERRRKVMLGDTGSNALGAVLGVSAAGLPWWGQALMVVLLVAFHLWAEKHSLTAWIESHPVARRIDGWGSSETE